MQIFFFGSPKFTKINIALLIIKFKTLIFRANFNLSENEIFRAVFLNLFTNIYKKKNYFFCTRT